MPVEPLAVGLAAVGALLVYLGSPNQQLVVAAAGRGALVVLGLAVLVAGGWLLGARGGYGSSAVVFIELTVAMLAWVALPYLDVWRRLRRDRRANAAAQVR